LQVRIRALALLCLLIGASSISPSGVRGAITVPYAPTTSADIAPGVRYEHGTLVAHNRTQYVNVVEVDLAQDGLDLRLAQADGVATHRALVTDMAAAYDADERNVVASVNGSTLQTSQTRSSQTCRRRSLPGRV
jgi:hypothetical protein